jgi:hypothetical protein
MHGTPSSTSPRQPLLLLVSNNVWSKVLAPAAPACYNWTIGQSEMLLGHFSSRLFVFGFHGHCIVATPFTAVTTEPRPIDHSLSFLRHQTDPIHRSDRSGGDGSSREDLLHPTSTYNHHSHSSTITHRQSWGFEPMFATSGYNFTLMLSIPAHCV